MKRSLALGLVLVACGSCKLPDLAPFAKTTAEISHGIDSLHTVVKEDLQIAGLEDQAATWDTDFGVVVSSGKAIVRYSDALTAIVHSGTHGEDNANKLVGAVSGLAKTFGVSVPEPLKTVVVEVWGLAARALARQALMDAMRKADIVVKQLGPKIKDQLDLAVQVAASSEAKLRTTARNGERTISGIADKEVFWKRKAIRDELAEKAPATDSWLVALLRGWADRRMTVLRAQLEQSDADWALLSAELRRIEKRYSDVRRAIERLRTALHQWVDTHGSILSAMENDGGFDWRALTASAIDIRNAIDRIEKE